MRVSARLARINSDGRSHSAETDFINAAAAADDYLPTFRHICFRWGTGESGGFVGLSPTNSRRRPNGSSYRIRDGRIARVGISISCVARHRLLGCFHTNSKRVFEASMFLLFNSIDYLNYFLTRWSQFPSIPMTCANCNALNFERNYFVIRPRRT